MSWEMKWMVISCVVKGYMWTMRSDGITFSIIAMGETECIAKMDVVWDEGMNLPG